MNFLSKIALTFAFQLLIWPLNAWMAMLGFGVLHGIWPEVPTISYGQGFLVTLAVGLIVAPATRNTSLDVQ